jgi:hypothetical protein
MATQIFRGFGRRLRSVNKDPLDRDAGERLQDDGDAGGD